jgi:hypothetical protein
VVAVVGVVVAAAIIIIIVLVVLLNDAVNMWAIDLWHRMVNNELRVM